MRLPLRLRVTLVFAAGMAVVLFALSAFVYVRMGAALLDQVDAGLRSRAQVLVAEVEQQGPEVANVEGTLIEQDEAFAQIADASGRVVHSSLILHDVRLLPSATIRGLSHAGFFDRVIPRIDDVTRVFAVPVSDGLVVMVGTSLDDRREQLLQLAVTLAIAEPIALLVISLAGWLLAGAALRPVEAMRRKAAAISLSEPGRRLPVPPTRDELERLGTTLNSMLQRLQDGMERERRVVDQASHELRSPLAVLKTELDLALARERTRPELEAAVRSAAQETDRLARLADDLLVLARADRGRLPVHRQDVRLADLVEAARAAAAAGGRDVRLTTSVVPSGARARVDPLRVRQALDNLLENAMRHARTRVDVVAERTDGAVSIVVEDDGRGFPEGFADRALEPFTRGDRDGEAGSGLGLAIVRAIAEAHRGSVEPENAPHGGARVTLTLATEERATGP